MPAAGAGQAEPSVARGYSHTVVRRPQGALETDVLEIMWASGEAMTPGEVLAALDADLAYTTVMTIQARLLDKGLLVRERRGRAYAYRPVVTEAEMRAGKMSDALAAARDREAVLGRFVDSLSADEAAALRVVLDRLESDRG